MTNEQIKILAKAIREGLSNIAAALLIGLFFLFIALI